MHVREFNHPASLASGIEELLKSEANRWSQVRFMARIVVQAGADLDDESDVIRCLMARRYCAADFADEVDDVISEAREIGRARQ